MKNARVQGGNFDRPKRWCFTVPGVPVPKGRPRVVHKDRRGRMRDKPRTYTPKTTKIYADKVAKLALAAGVRRIPAPRHVFLGILIYLSEAAVMDGDNVLKTALDSLQGIAYDNDRQVWCGSFQREVDAANPRMTIIIEEIK